MISFLYIIGALGAVSNLEKNETDSAIELMWCNPFSLNLTTAEPDIANCVDVYNVTSGKTQLISSNCSVFEECFIFRNDHNPDPAHVFLFVITPRNNLEGAINGTSSQLFGQFLPQSKTCCMILYKFKDAAMPIT